LVESEAKVAGLSGRMPGEWNIVLRITERLPRGLGDAPYLFEIPCCKYPLWSTIV